MLRKALESEQNDTFNTRIIVHVSDRNLISGLLPSTSLKRRRSNPIRLWTGNEDPSNYLKWLVLSSDVEFEFVDRTSDRSFKHYPNWQARSSEEFIKDVIGPDRGSDFVDYAKLYSESLTAVRDDRGREIGRAAITLGHPDTRISTAFARVGGLTYPAYPVFRGSSKTALVLDYVGVIEGEAVIATRRQAELAVSPSALGVWATEQARLGLSRSLSTTSVIRIHCLGVRGVRRLFSKLHDRLARPKRTVSFLFLPTHCGSRRSVSAIRN